MELLYVLTTLAATLMASPIYRAALRNIVAWKSRDSSWQVAVLISATLLLAITLLAWLYLVFITLGSWFSSLDDSRPKPAFIMLWVIGAFIYGFGISFVSSLHALAMRDYKKNSFWS